MAYQVFLVPSVLESDRAPVWQLQLLADAYGFAIKSAHRTGLTTLSQSDCAAINASDAVVLIATKPLDKYAMDELRHACKTGRPVLALIEESVPHSGLPVNCSVVTFSRGTTVNAIAGTIQQHVQSVVKPPQSPASSGLSWLLGIAVGLFVLGVLAKTDHDDDGKRPGPKKPKNAPTIRG